MLVASKFWKGTKIPENESELTSYARRVPAVAKVRDAKENNRRERCRTCVVKLVDFVIRKPEAAVELWTSVESDIVGPVASLHKPEVVDEMIACKTGAASVGQLRVEQKAMILCALPEGPSASLLDKIHVVDND